MHTWHRKVCGAFTRPLARTPTGARRSTPALRTRCSISLSTPAPQAPLGTIDVAICAGHTATSCGAATGRGARRRRRVARSGSVRVRQPGRRTAPWRPDPQATRRALAPFPDDELTLPSPTLHALPSGPRHAGGSAPWRHGAAALCLPGGHRPPPPFRARTVATSGGDARLASLRRWNLALTALHAAQAVRPAAGAATSRSASPRPSRGSARHPVPPPEPLFDVGSAPRSPSSSDSPRWTTC